MGLFRRRRPLGRHAAPPAGRSAVPAPLAPWDTPGTTAAPAPFEPPPLLAPPQAVVPPAETPPEAPRPRVELGFRDGSTTALAPDSAQARALTEIADVLTRRD